MIFAISKGILSLILVPAFIAALLILLYVLLSKRNDKDTLAVLQFGIKDALARIGALQKITPKELRRTDYAVSKLQLIADRAAFEDVYDLSPCIAELEAARNITSAVSAAQLDSDEAKKYLTLAAAHLTAATDYIAAYCGVSGAEMKKISFNLFNKKAKAEKARRYLDSLKAGETSETEASPDEEEAH